MKGLLIKDLKLIKLQKNFLVLVVAIAAGLTAIKDDPTFILGFLTFVTMLLALSTITYDEFDNGAAFLFTLPVSRRGYVAEKYGFSFLTGAAAWVLAGLLSVLINGIKGTLPSLEVAATAALIFPIMLILQAVMLPFQLKFGGEKGRIAMAGAVGLLIVIGFFVLKIGEALGVDLLEILNRLSAVGMGTLALAASLAGIAVFLISMGISVSIMEKKEF